MGFLWNLDGSGQSLRRDPDQHAAQPLKTGVWRKKAVSLKPMEDIIGIQPNKT